MRNRDGVLGDRRRPASLTPLEVGAAALLLVVAVVLGVADVAGRTRPDAAAGPAGTPGPPPRAATSHPVPELGDLLPTPPAPTSVVVGADGRLGYLLGRGQRTVTVLDLLSRDTVATITMPATPRTLALDPTGARLWVGCHDEGAGTGRVVEVDARTSTAVAAVTTVAPAALAPTPDGRALWVLGREAGAIDVVATDTRAVVRRLPAPGDPRDVVLAAGRAYLLDDAADVVRVLDPADGRVLATVPVGAGPRAGAASPDGSRVAVVDEDGGRVALIDTGTDRLAAVVAVGQGPRDVAYAPDGRYLYTADERDGTISSVDAAAGALVATVQVGAAPTEVRPAPAGRLAYVTVRDEARLAVLFIGH